MTEIIHTDNAPAAIGPYSQAVRCGSLLFTSGQIAICPATGAIEATDIAAQTRQVCENLAAVLAAAGTDPSRVVKTTCFLKNMADFAAFNEVYGSYFPGRPARSCVAAAALPKDALVEIEVVAEV